MRIIKFIVVIIVLILLYMRLRPTDASKNVGSKSSATNLSIEETRKLIEDQEELFILDVRTKEEFGAGHIKGATVIPLDSLKNRLEEIVEYKDKPILVYCRSGSRSSQAVKILLNNNFTQIYHMHKGFMNW